MKIFIENAKCSNSAIGDIIPCVIYDSIYANGIKYIASLG